MYIKEIEHVLDDTDRKVAAACITSFGEGNHPMATAGTIRYFDLAYLIRCITTGLQRQVTPDAQKLMLRLLDKIKAGVKRL